MFQLTEYSSVLECGVVFGCLVAGLPKDRSAFICRVNKPEKALRNVGSYSFNDTISRHRRPEFSASPLFELQILHFSFFFYMEIKGEKNRTRRGRIF